MREYVHVKDESGHEFAWPAELVDGVDGVTVTKKSPLGPDGEPVAPKYKTTVAKAAAKKAATRSSESGQQADPEKEIGR